MARNCIKYVARKLKRFQITICAFLQHAYKENRVLAEAVILPEVEPPNILMEDGRIQKRAETSDCWHTTVAERHEENSVQMHLFNHFSC